MKKVFVLAIIVICIIFFTPMYKVLTFTETRVESPTLYFLDLHKKEFQMIFTHSIHLSDVVETYKVTNSDEIQPISMQYSDVAIGMPSYAEEGQTLIYEDGIYTLYYNQSVTLPDFSLYIGDVDYKLDLKHDGKTYHLKNNLQRGHSYVVEVQEVSLYEKLKGVHLHDGK